MMITIGEQEYARMAKRYAQFMEGRVYIGSRGRLSGEEIRRRCEGFKVGLHSVAKRHKLNEKTQRHLWKDALKSTNLNLSYRGHLFGYYISTG